MNFLQQILNDYIFGGTSYTLAGNIDPWQFNVSNSHESIKNVTMSNFMVINNEANYAPRPVSKVDFVPMIPVGVADRRTGIILFVWEP